MDIEIDTETETIYSESDSNYIDSDYNYELLF